MDANQRKGYSSQILFQIYWTYDHPYIYAPTEDTDEQIKDEFYGSLQDVLDMYSGNFFSFFFICPLYYKYNQIESYVC